jgi:IS5 family transposase
MKQLTLAAGSGFEKHGRATRKAEFLVRMDRLMPWAEFCALIEPHYPKAGNGRPPVGLERILRMYCVANWFNLSDEACEDALYDVAVFREFCRIDLGRERIPDATTLLKFRHLLEEHKLGAALFAKVEHPFLTLKRLGGFAKVRYRGLAKNANRAFAMLAMLNIFKWGRPLTGEVRLA